MQAALAAPSVNVNLLQLVCVAVGAIAAVTYHDCAQLHAASAVGSVILATISCPLHFGNDLHVH